MSSSYGGGANPDPISGVPDPDGYPAGAAAGGYAEGAHIGGYSEGSYSDEASAPYAGGTYEGQSGASSVGTDRPYVEDESVGSLVGRLTGDLSTLMRQELDLAKAELREEAKKAGTAAGMLAAAGVAGLLFLIMASLTLTWLLDKIMYLWLAALIVTLLWGIAAAVLGLSGKKKMAEVNPKPEQTIETLKEDKQWVQAQKN
ncbi:MAG TPA: phage holin family protein, partial [Gemmatimonadales bacterium]|nr:phage holin family protein [Gemmatimonadales bacterium]